MKSKSFYIIGLLAFVFGLLGCTNNCYVPMEAQLGVAFVNDKVVKPLTMQHLTVQGIGSDSVLYKDAWASEIYLPLHINANQTAFKVDFGHPSKPDSIVHYTFTIDHTSYPQYVSPECGCAQFFTVQSFVANDSTATPNVLNSEIFDSNVVNVSKSIHIKIHF